MHKPSVKSMQTFLLGNGYDKSHIDAMSEEELFEIYSKKVRQEVQESQHELLDNIDIRYFAQVKKQKELDSKVQEIQKQICRVNHSVRKVYDIIDAFIEDFSLDELRYFILNGINKIPSNIVDRVIQIKSYQYRIFWLEKIEENLAPLPEEERHTLMEKYTKPDYKDSRLYQIYKNSFDQKELQKMVEIARKKLDVIKHFLPEALEESYATLHEEDKEKNKIIEEIMSFTHSYPRNTLKKMTMKQLRNLGDFIREKMREEQRDHRIIEKYVQMIEESMRSVEDAEFQMVCMDAINRLSNPQLQKVIETLNTKNKFFASKFESVARSLRGKINAKLF
ncbi:hypothetical protein [Helicobacter mustelae]|uniref:Uncharacterized protein n=1 Tax=Helicobacter mustelae (strain ATCC 43772 / CCUG 25715 / CIP 103759 / LMG 18044 / NCTC 12198 / R85-136P) TaxID=679897 RepID=D3UFZ0_HELM1|nr:hypothetical protein [Helicobacter mustelae]CBG39411.1 Putative hypothetical protein [Helicobacter mustelae 12198]SQH70924.1 Uncharacterised protein [Helicobacter mustelae]STP12051.1 Uncharacterised protein [Helicobacter mustelae]